MPEWSTPLRAELSRELDLAEQAATASEARRSRLAAELASAERELAVVEAETAPARQALATATNCAAEARWQRNEAARRLDATGLRGRLAARRELNAAGAREDNALDYRERTRQRTLPAVDHYTKAPERIETHVMR
jgi:hypothetical protein